FFKFKLYETLVLIILFYLNAYVLVPKFLFVKKYILYIVCVTVIILSGMHISKLFMPPKIPRNSMPFEMEKPEIQHNLQLIESAEYKDMKHNYLHNKFKRIEQKRANFIGLLLLVIFALSTGYTYAIQMYAYETQMKQLQHAHIESQLQLLKSQINPHFLFNTLNSIYSLSLKKSDVTPKAILQVSEMLRYMTYDAQNQFVPIEREIAYIQNYIALQKLRVSSESILEFSVTGVTSNVQIAPMIFLPFIENACKHGISKDSTLTMCSTITITETKIYFTVTNTLYNIGNENENKGIGITNVSQRLQALYPGKHILDIAKSNDEFTVSLQIQYV
ncbi:MAG TPA: sensor histidine kinase, partial [Bacteroidales bacterium]|nr:sensor histidine kinase [Bacteroidales bacterium]